MDRDHKIRCILRGFHGPERERRMMRLLRNPERLDDAMGQRLINHPSDSRSGGAPKVRRRKDRTVQLTFTVRTTPEAYLRLRDEAAAAKTSVTNVLRRRSRLA